MRLKVQTYILSLILAGAAPIGWADYDYGSDYRSGNDVGVRSFAAQKDPDFRVADYGSGRDSTQRYTGTFKNRNAGGMGEDVTVASGSEKSSSEGGKRTPVRSNSSRSGVNLSEESKSASLNEASSANPNQNSKQIESDSRPARWDQAFAKKAAEGNATEVAMGKLGAERASNPRVKDYANRVIRDHGQANQKLLDLDISKSAKISLQEIDLNKKAEGMMKGKAGTDFDKHFIDHMLLDHAKAARAYREASINLKDSALKDYAQETLSVIQEHLRIAKQLQAELNGGKSQDLNPSDNTSEIQ